LGGVFSPSPPAQKKRKIANFFAPYHLPDVGEVRTVYAGNWSTEVVNIWRDLVGKLGISSKKTAMGHFPPKFLESRSSKTTGPIEKIKGVQKWYRHPLFSCRV